MRSFVALALAVATVTATDVSSNTCTSGGVCNEDNCYRAVLHAGVQDQGGYYFNMQGVLDCYSAIPVVTLGSTTTVTSTVTASFSASATASVTYTTVTTSVTTTRSTQLSTITSITTPSTTTTRTSTVITSSQGPSGESPQKKRADAALLPAIVIPVYASWCSGQVRYTSACSCHGVIARTTSATTTATVTSTVTKSLTATTTADTRTVKTATSTSLSTSSIRTTLTTTTTATAPTSTSTVVTTTTTTRAAGGIVSSNTVSFPQPGSTSMIIYSFGGLTASVLPYFALGTYGTCTTTNFARVFFSQMPGTIYQYLFDSSGRVLAADLTLSVFTPMFTAVADLSLTRKAGKMTPFLCIDPTIGQLNPYGGSFDCFTGDNLLERVWFIRDNPTGKSAHPLDPLQAQLVFASGAATFAYTETYFCD